MSDRAITGKGLFDEYSRLLAMQRAGREREPHGGIECGDEANGLRIHTSNDDVYMGSCGLNGGRVEPDLRVHLWDRTRGAMAEVRYALQPEWSADDERQFTVLRREVYDCAGASPALRQVSVASANTTVAFTPNRVDERSEHLLRDHLTSATSPPSDALCAAMGHWDIASHVV